MSALGQISHVVSANQARFSGYQAIDNCVVPLEGALSQDFNPWSEYRLSVGRSRVFEPPYMSLLHLTKNLKFEESPFSLWQPSENGKEEILAWCSRNGMLGVLPAIFREITLPSTWMIGKHDRRGILVPRYLLQNGAWYDRSEVNPPLRLSQESLTNAREGELLQADVVPAFPRKAEAVVSRWEYFDVERQDLTKTFHSFFPRVPPQERQRHRFPCPGSDEFWKEYGEPFDVFGRWATRFLEGAQILGSADFSLPPDKQPYPVGKALLFMQTLAGVGGSSFQIDPKIGRLRKVHQSPALLVTYAEMFLNDMELGRRLTSCSVCNRLFVSAGVEAQYCTNRCRNTMQRRRSRKVHREM